MSISVLILDRGTGFLVVAFLMARFWIFITRFTGLGRCLGGVRAPLGLLFLALLLLDPLKNKQRVVAARFFLA
jgi:hypothetical protein